MLLNSVSREIMGMGEDILIECRERERVYRLSTVFAIKWNFRFIKLKNCCFN